MSQINIEEFFKEYKEYVLQWVRGANSSSKYFIDEGEFLSSFMEKVVSKRILEKYVPQKGEFRYWLNKVLTNHYIDLYRKEKPRITIVSGDEEVESMSSAITEDRLAFNEWEKANTTDIDFVIIDRLINQIPDIKQRVLVKLKLYRQTEVSFPEDEIRFMSELSGFSADEVKEYIDSRAKHDLGLREKDIHRLTGYAKGSIGTTYKRVVRKHVAEPYKARILRRNT